MTDQRDVFLRYLEGQASPEELAALGEWMSEDEEHARQLARLSLLELHLHERYLLLRENTGPPAAEIEPPAPTPEMPKADNSGFFPALWDSLPSVLDGRTPRATFWILFIPVAAVFFGSFGWLVWSSRPDMHVADAPKPPKQVQPEEPEYAVAYLGDHEEAVWADGSEGIPSGGRGFFEGKTAELASGLAQIKFKDGAEVVVEGPCKITFQGRNAALLEQGKLSATVEMSSAKGFIIDTPFGTVTDLGTEFGVAVGEDKADIEVHEGVVVLDVPDTGRGKQSIRLGVGQRASVDRAGNVSRDAGGVQRLDIVRQRPQPPGEEPEDPVQARIITNFRNFSETGNLLGGSNSREQRFTARGASVTIAHAGGDDAGQEIYLSDEFPTLAAGDRVSVDWVGTDSSTTEEQWGLAITSGEVASGQNAIFWCWRSGGALNITVRNATTGGGERISGNAPDTLFIEKTATGWTMGSITGGVETKHFDDISSLRGIDITADGSALGLFSDMRSTSNPKTLRNLTIRRQGAAEEARGDPGTKGGLPATER